MQSNMSAPKLVSQVVRRFYHGRVPGSVLQVTQGSATMVRVGQVRPRAACAFVAFENDEVKELNVQGRPVGVHMGPVDIMQKVRTCMAKLRVGFVSILTPEALDVPILRPITQVPFIEPLGPYEPTPGTEELTLPAHEAVRKDAEHTAYYLTFVEAAAAALLVVVLILGVRAASR